jgi:hypothetical protein
LIVALCLIVVVSEMTCAFRFADPWYIYAGGDIPWYLQPYVESIEYSRTWGCQRGGCHDMAVLNMTPLGVLTVANATNPISSGGVAYAVALFVTGTSHWPTSSSSDRHPRSALSVAKEILAHCLGLRTSMHIQYHFEGLSPAHQLYFGH